ncbi:translation initiation protein Sua5 [Moelleriella libera RCEF 2490]|uniref:Threonylcarbamoyl-AMP synthase n=1 Tax=Moelleriella libera RCEF 2490 TaxID=1081109 RepID=A0A166UVX4_9HYPO|nr:translation initiation protein Sua5 [Moelleriella libera RCEF 2490]
MNTRIVTVPRRGDLGYFDGTENSLGRLRRWHIRPEAQDVIAILQPAAECLRTKDTPVAFPTETVYGLGADATRSGSVRGIYSAKGRPSDNPLIVHVADLDMLRHLLGPDNHDDDGENCIPARYLSVIEKFWPGPLTILLPIPEPSPLAPEVTAGLRTFGVRMPSSALALTLIKLAGVPLAAPSANASTKPSPTSAQHVKDDLEGRIELILDGGACDVGVESTVVDGLNEPPVVLRPGGISLEELRGCRGWENVVKAYKDQSEEGQTAPRAPGMKYKHYSPRARVVLYESKCMLGQDGLVAADADAAAAAATTTSVNGDGPSTNVGLPKRVGVIRTRRWKPAAGLRCDDLRVTENQDEEVAEPLLRLHTGRLRNREGDDVGELFDLDLGEDAKGIAQGLFSALRALDRRQVDIIFVDGIDDELDIAAAVMNRLRKAASDIRA